MPSVKVLHDTLFSCLNRYTPNISTPSDEVASSPLYVVMNLQKCRKYDPVNDFSISIFYTFEIFTKLKISCAFYIEQS